MNKNIATAPVHVIRDETGLFRPANPAVRRLSCNSRMLLRENLRIATITDQCKTHEEGNAVAVADASTIATVKMRTDVGSIWIAEGDYDTFLAACNNCCGT